MRRAAFTLVELIIALALLGVVLGAMLGLLNRQRRFYAGAAQIVTARVTVREAIDLLPRDFRGLSPAEGDIYAMGASSIEYRASMGISVVCTVGGSRRSITIAPSSIGGLTQWSSEPQLGDSLWLFDPGAAADDSDDRWRIAATTTAPSSGMCPMASGFTTSVAEESRGYALDLDRALPASIGPGSAVRFFRRARYELYRASDGKWYLGYLDCVASRAIPCSEVQPVSGPYLSGASAPPGLALTYFDGTGAVTASRDRVARIDVISRAETSGDVAVDGMRPGPHRDSLAVSIHLRN
ncbi:MAG: type II secretion system GspH family protein [Gemmatimonadota bacterium]|nr:type II secretion system GspH family protein [Gemmatimonadota bacterium]